MQKVRPEAGRRHVLAVARTITSVVRLLDELDAVRGDLRVRVSFWVDDGSRFSRGVRELLSESGVRVLSDEEARGAAFDLVLTASENATVPGVDAPVLVLPHGVGFHKYLRDVDGTPRISGVSIGHLAGHPGLRLTIAHRDQRDQLRRAAPDLADRAILVRDSYFDRLAASEPLRPVYREALEVGRRTLVVVSSTWGEHALAARHPDLPARLLAALPADEYAVAAILHPNLWSGQGDWQIRAWLAEALDAGLVLVPAHRGWPAVVTAADLVIGDHGSVTFYAASRGRPVLLAGTGGDETIPQTPLAALASSAPQLDRDKDLRTQVEHALSTAPDPATRDAAFDPEAHTNVHQLILDILRLDQRETHRAWPIPDLPVPKVASYQVQTSRSLQVERFPAAVAAPGPDRHLVTYDDEIDLGRRDSASSILSRRPRPEPEARSWLEQQARHRFLAACATPDGTVLVQRGTQTLRVTGASLPRAEAIVHHLTMTRRPLPAGEPTLTITEA